MGNLRRRVLSVALGLLATPFVSAQDVRRSGSKFELVLHPGDLPADLAGRLADEALAAVEAVLPVLSSWQVAPTKKVTVHLYGAEPAFRKIEGSAAYQRPYFVDGAGVAHVPLRPQATEQALQRIGLPTLAQDMLVVAAGAAAAQQRFPLAAEEPWLAGVVGFGTLEQLRNSDNSFGFDPGFDTRRSIHADPRNKWTLAQWTATEAPLNQGIYDASLGAQCLIAQLGRASGKGWVKKLLGPKQGKNPVKARELAFAALLGEQKQREQKWSQLLAQLEPDFRVRYGSVGRTQGRLLLVGASQMTWLRPSPEAPYVLRGRCELGGGRHGELQGGVWFARADTANGEERLFVVFLSVGRVCLSKLQGDGIHPVRDAEAEIAIGVPFEYSIHVDATLRVSIDGKRVLEVPGLTQLAGSWGVGSEGAPVWFESPRLEVAAAAK